MSWYLVQTKPNAHALAERNLQRQGLSTFLPMQEVTGRKSSRFVNKIRPLFPGYLFVEVPEGQAPWRSINGTLGVARLVRFGEMPEPVPEGLVAALRARCDADGHFVAPNELSAGDAIEIARGPFAHFVAEVEKVSPDQRVWVLLDLMGQKTRVSLEGDQVSKI